MGAIMKFWHFDPEFDFALPCRARYSVNATHTNRNTHSIEINLQ